jgi:hypothetical protein
MKVVLLAVLALSAFGLDQAPTEPVKGSLNECATEVLSAVDYVKRMIYDIEGLIGGDKSQLAHLLSDSKGFLGAVKALPSDCSGILFPEIGKPSTGQCIKALDTLFSSAHSVIEAIENVIEHGASPFTIVTSILAIKG